MLRFDRLYVEYKKKIPSQFCFETAAFDFLTEQIKD